MATSLSSSALFLIAAFVLAFQGTADAYGVHIHHPNAVRYDGHAIYRVNLVNRPQAELFTKFFLSLEEGHTSKDRRSINGNEKLVLDIYPDFNIQLGDNFVHANNKKLFEEALNKLKIEYEMVVADVQEDIDRERIELLEAESRERLRSPSQQDFFTTYRSFDDFVKWMDNLAATYPNIVTPIKLGTTVEGRDIVGIKVTSSSNKKAPKPGIFYNGCQHAREWISPMTVAFIANQLITQYGKNQTVTQLVDEFEWTLVPITNVDGYLYTQTSRLWRKNRKVDPKTRCVGVDINRNWGYKWNTGGSSSDPCSDIYMGSAPFSEPENKALADYIQAHPNIVGYIDYHSYSQLYMTPWGWTSSLPADYKIQLQLAKDGVVAMGAVHGVHYQAGNVYNIIYQASGGSLDWTYGASNVKFSYAIELRDTGRYGFVLPASQIVPQGEEAFAGVVSMGQFISKHLASEQQQQ